MQIDRDSVGYRVFSLTATDITGVKVVVLSPVYVAIKPLGERPKDDDWIGCIFSDQVLNTVEVPFNLEGGFNISAWDPGMYRWFIKPTYADDTPVLLGPDFLEIL
jgi:hypothetical protein